MESENVLSEKAYSVFDGANLDPEFAIALKKFLATYAGAQISTLVGNITITGNLNVQGIYKQNGTSGVSGGVTLAKLTGGGTTGSLTFTDGIITAFSSPT